MDFSGPEKEFTSAEFKGVALKNEIVDDREFDTCVFVKCSLREIQFTGCKFRNCTFRGCDLSLSSFENCLFAETHFEDSQLVGLDWTRTAWAKSKFIQPVSFVGCVLNYSTFTGLNLKQVNLKKCIAHDVDFTEADLTRTDCTFTDFANSRFQDTNLTEADFTGASNYAIAPDLNKLKKTRFSLPEAMALLYGLDIILTE